MCKQQSEGKTIPGRNLGGEILFIMDSETELTTELLEEYINQHKAEAIKLRKKMDMYKGQHDILSRDPKEAFKPDNRLVVNFAKYIVDTLNGFFIGIPVKTVHDNESVSDYIEFIQKYNDQDDNNAELSKLCSIYGHAYELLYLDENAQVGITYLSPEEAFIIFDDSVAREPLYGVRYFTNSDEKIEGSYSDKNKIYHFEIEDGLRIVDEEQNYFGDIPLVEYLENEERQGAFDNVDTLINAYDKAISEKANDVDYYADAYLKVLGAELEEETLQTLRDSRIINISSPNGDDVSIDFLAKPSSDTTQENLINRLEKLIFQISMVANINDENFGNASGISLKYKLQSMLNLANVKERKFVSGMNRRWKLISNLPNSKMSKDDWMGIEYQFTRNLPANVLEETQIAQNLAGIVSEETQLKALSLVENVKDEIERKEAEVDKKAQIYGFNDLGDIDEQ